MLSSASLNRLPTMRYSILSERNLEYRNHLSCVHEEIARVIADKLALQPRLNKVM
jgi:hypothetical protein